MRSDYFNNGFLDLGLLYKFYYESINDIHGDDFLIKKAKTSFIRKYQLTEDGLKLITKLFHLSPGGMRYEYVNINFEEGIISDLCNRGFIEEKVSSGGSKILTLKKSAIQAFRNYSPISLEQEA